MFFCCLCHEAWTPVSATNTGPGPLPPPPPPAVERAPEIAAPDPATPIPDDAANAETDI